MVGSSITTIKSSDTRECRRQGDFFACYERGECTPLLQDEHMTTDIGQGWVANPPSPLPGDVADSAPVVPTVRVDAGNDTSPTFETTRDPLLLIGRRGGRRLQDDRVVSLGLDAFQQAGLEHTSTAPLKTKETAKKSFAALFNTF